MTIYFSNTEELNKVVRQVLILQSGLQSTRVLNSLSIYGEDLDKLLEDEIYGSIERNDAMLLFELRSRDSTSNMTQTNDDDTLLLVRSFTLHVILYGNSSSDIASILKTRLETEKVRLSFVERGIYIEDISMPQTLNEYKNQTMWLRNDFDINLTCSFLIEQISKDSSFETLSKMTLI